MRLPRKFLSSLVVFGIFILFSNQLQAATWTQTSQADWQLGSGTNIDTNTSAGNVLLSKDSISYTDTTRSDFEFGYSENNDMTTIASSSNAVTLTRSFVYSRDSSPAALSSNTTYDSFLDHDNDLLYVATYAGLDVIDTKGTAATQDDERWFTYNQASTPFLPRNRIQYADLDSSTGLLYVSTSDGVSVINTQGTATTTDDVLEAQYGVSSNPALVSGSTYHTWYDHNTDYLYVATFDGLHVFETNATATSSDDALLFVYNPVNIAGMATDNINHSWLNDSTGILYISTGVGLHAINTQGTATTSDDILSIRYTNTSSPALSSSNVESSYIDHSTDLLYVNTGQGISVIDTQGTAASADDVSWHNYRSNNSPALQFGDAETSYLESTNGYLYVGHYRGVSVIDTKQTATTSDDTVVAYYSQNTDPGISDPEITDIWYDATSSIIYINTNAGGLTTIHSAAVDQGTFVGRPVAIASSSAKVISWSESISGSADINIQTRTGSSSAYWRDDFDDGTPPTIIDNLDADARFSNIYESGGYLHIKGTTVYESLASFQIDTGKPADYFPAGSVIKMRFRVIYSESTFLDYISLDDYEDMVAWGAPIDMNEWVELTIIAPASMSMIAFEPSWGGTWDDTDGFEFDWISIESPDKWNAWSSSYANPSGSLVASDLGQTLIQYRAIMSSDGANAPSLNSLTLSSGYEASGTYTSPIYDTGVSSDWGTMSWSETSDGNSSLSFKVRTGAQPNLSDASSFGSLSQSIISGTTDLSGLDGVVDGNRYVQFQASFSSTAAASSPNLASVSINYTQQVAQQSSGGSSIPPASTQSVPSSQTVVVNETREAVSVEPVAEPYTQNIIQEIIDISIAQSTVVDLVSQAEAEQIMSMPGVAVLDSQTEDIVEKIIPSAVATTIDPAIKASIINFISAGTKTTMSLGEGERAGVVDSFIFAFGVYPETEEDWSDVIKIANGRWPTQVNVEAAARAEEEFETIYLRRPDRTNPHDDAAVVVMAYGLRPAIRNLESEAAAIMIFEDIYYHLPATAEDWNIVRAIAYSGAKR